MKVFAYSGTSRKETSNTFKVIQALLEQMEQNYDGELEYKIYHPGNANIMNCIGCVNCFKGKICPLDRQDDMAQIKQEMLDSDVIIIGSPVFLHHVSGTVKTFIDRASYWAHLFKLTGKVGLSVSTSSTNGNEYVDYYLDKCHLYWGVHAVKPLSLPLDLLEGDEVAELINEASGQLITAYQNLKSLNPTQKQEITFLTFKHLYLSQERKLYESSYWIDNGLTTFENFTEFRNAILNGAEVKKRTRNLY